MMERDDERTQLRYAQALADWADAGGYEAEVLWDTCTVAALGIPFEKAQWREVRTLSGGEQKRLVLEALLRGPDEVLLLDEPDNYLDVPGKRWLEEPLRESPKTVLFVSHDRELLARSATRVVTVELGAGGNTAWTHGGGFATYHQARKDRFDAARGAAPPLGRGARQAQGAGRSCTSRRPPTTTAWPRRYQAAHDPAAEVRGGRPAGGDPAGAGRHDAAARRAHRQARGRLRAAGADRADEAVRPRGLVRRPGRRARARTAPASRTSCGCWPLGGTDPDVEHRPVDDTAIAPVAHTGRARLGARVRPGWFAQTHEHPELVGRTLLDILWRGDDHRDGLGREQASRALDRYELAHAAEQTFDSLSGGQQARLQILLLELSGATLLLLDEPTDNLDLASAEALEEGLEAFEGTVIAVTHDRWFARGFDRFLVFGADGEVYESDEPVWDEGRVQRAR